MLDDELARFEVHDVWYTISNIYFSINSEWRRFLVYLYFYTPDTVAIRPITVIGDGCFIKQNLLDAAHRIVRPAYQMLTSLLSECIMYIEMGLKVWGIYTK